MRNKFWLCLRAISISSIIILANPSTAFLQGAGISIVVGTVDPKTFPEISATLAVLDASGLGVPNLAGENFLVIEDSRPVTVTSAKATSNPDAPVAVCLAIDVSGSMGELVGGTALIDSAKSAARTFVDSMGPKDRVCLIAFGDKVDISTPLVFDSAKEMDFTGDKNALKNLIDALTPDRNPGTPLYDAALKAIKITATQPPGTRAVILITDGKDERLAPDGRTLLPGSVSTAERPSAAAKEARVPVFTIGLGQAIDARYLQRLAEETGGRYQEIPTADRLSDLYRNILSQLKTQYALTYTSQLFPDGNNHLLHIRARTPLGEAETRATFALPRAVGAKPFIRLYYREGDERKPLSDGQKLKGTVTVAPEIAAAQSISYTVFLIDGSPVYTTTVAPWTFSWDTSKLSADSHNLVVRAQDDRGATAETSAQVEIVPMSIVDAAVALPLETKIGVAGLTVVALCAGAVAIMRTRRPQKRMCPRGLHVLPRGETVCALCAREEMQETVVEMPAIPEPSASEGETVTLDTGEAPPTVVLEQAVLNVGLLVMERGDHPGKEFRLHPDETTIGRAATNDIIVEDPTMGRQQSKIRLEGTDFWIYDLAATNPTWVNGKKVTGRRKLAEDDRIEMGEIVFVFKQVRGK